MDVAPAGIDHALARSGTPLDPALRQEMGQRFDHDFSRVRVYTGRVAGQSARDLSADAYTSAAQNELRDNVEDGILSSQGRGAPLPPVTRAFMEHSLKSDLGSVRVHTDAVADSLSAALHSYAFTSGNDIYFASGQYHPGTIEGDRLLAHELVHTIQQGASRRQIQRKDWGQEHHEEIQQRLRAANPKLITEAPMPGSAPARKRKGVFKEGRNYVDPDKVGYADLYLSEGNVVSGVRREAKRFRNLEGLERKVQAESKSCGKTYADRRSQMEEDSRLSQMVSCWGNQAAYDPP